MMLLTYSVLRPIFLKMPKMAQTADKWGNGVRYGADED